MDDGFVGSFPLFNKRILKYKYFWRKCWTFILQETQLNSTILIIYLLNMIGKLLLLLCNCSPFQCWRSMRLSDRALNCKNHRYRSPPHPAVHTHHHLFTQHHQCKTTGEQKGHTTRPMLKCDSDLRRLENFFHSFSATFLPSMFRRRSLN